MPRRRARARRPRCARSSERAGGCGRPPPGARARDGGRARPARATRLSGAARASAAESCPRGRRRTDTTRAPAPSVGPASLVPHPDAWLGPARSRRRGPTPDPGVARRSASAVALFDKRSDQVDRRREDDRRRLRRAELEQRLQVAQLQRDRVAADRDRRVLQPLSGLVLALGVDDLCAPLALCLRLARHRALHAARNLDVLHLDDRDLDAPGRGRLVDDPLQNRVDLLALGQQLVEDVLAEDRPQRRLRDLRRRDHEVLDLHDRSLRIDDPEVRHRVHAHGHVVLRDHFLRGHSQCDGSQVDLHHAVDYGDEDEETRSFRRREQPAEPEDDAPFVLARDLDRREEEQDDQEQQDRDDDQRGVHADDPTPSGRTVSTSPSSDSTRTRSPGRSRPPSGVRACQSSPFTNTSPSRRTSPTAPAIASGLTSTGLWRTDHALLTANAQIPPSTTAIVITSGFDVWYGVGAFWNSMIAPTARQIRPATVKAPCDVTCTSATSSPTPASSRTMPRQLTGSTEKPKSAVINATSPSAPGSTTPGWKIS